MTTDANPMPSPQEPQQYLGYLPSAPVTPQAAPSAPVRGSGWLARVIAAISTAVVVAALGFPLGWLWASMAPRLPTVANGGNLYYVDPMGKQSAGAESWYAIIAIAAGVIIGVLAWVVLRRVRGPLILIALALGGGAAGWIMWRFGRTFGTNRDEAVALARSLPDGTRVNVSPDIRIQRNGLWHGFLPYIAGNLVYLAIAAVAAYAIIAGFTSHPNLMGRRFQPQPVAPPATPPPPADETEAGPENPWAREAAPEPPRDSGARG
jgi:hypothetical protein